MREAHQRWRGVRRLLSSRLRHDKPVIRGFRLGRLMSGPEQPTQVYRARRTESPGAGRLLALKTIPYATPAQRAGLRREDQISRAVVSPHVVRTFAVGAGATPPWLAAELVPGRNLRKIAPLRRNNHYLAACQALVDGLADLHRQGCAHCDIKPENIVYEGFGRLKFVDLMSSRRAGDPDVVEVTGTTGWMAPERHAGELTLLDEQRADVLSAALTLYFLRTGHHLIDDQPDRAQQMINNHYAWQPENLDVLPAELRPVIARALDYNPTVRPTAEELRAEIRRASAANAAQQPGWWRTRSTQVIAAITVMVAVSAGILTAIRTEDSRCPQGGYSLDHGDTVLRIGGLIARTGPVAGQEPAQSAALRLAVSDVRAVKTSQNYQVEEFRPGNEQEEGGPGNATVCASVDALLRNQTDVIIGPALSASALKVLDTVVGAGVLLVSPSSTAPELSTRPDGGRFFRTAASDELQARVLGRQIVDDGPGTVAVLTRDDAYGNGFRDVLKRSLDENGVRVVLQESYPLPPANYAALARRSAGKRPNALVLVGFEENDEILRALIAEGVNPQNTRIYGTDGNMSSTLPGQVDPNNPGILAGMRGTTLLPLNPDFRRRVETITGGPITELTYAAETYDAVVVMALAAAAAGTPNPDAMARQVISVTRTGEMCSDYASCLELIHQHRDIDYDGISGPLDFNDTGEPCRVSYPIIQFDAQGNMERLRTAEATNLCVTMR